MADTETPEWLTRQRAAIRAQQKAHAAIDPGDGTLVQVAGLSYTRGQAADFLAQIRNCLAAGAHLPNSGPNGLTVEYDTPRRPLSDSDRDDYEAIVAELEPKFTADEIADADAQLAQRLEDGVSLDPTTAENVALPEED